MRAVRITPAEYADIFPAPSHVYNSVAFNELNRHKCDDVHYVVLRDDKERVRFGIILGEKGPVLKSPFSAPFGGMEANGPQKVGQYVEAIKALKEYSDKEIRITLPPAIYDRLSNFAKQELAALTNCGKIAYCDYNFHLPLSIINDSYLSSVPRKVRQSINASFRSGLTFEHPEAFSKEIFLEIYNIILRNHNELDHPYHMSAEDFINTMPIVDMDFFIVRKEGKGIASAIVYFPSEKIAQPTGWGDLPQYRHLNPMNFIAYNIFRHYADNAKADIFDLGPSSSDGIPSVGLCDFKEGLGCTVTPKASIIL